MAALLHKQPYDEATGLPYLVFPYEDESVDQNDTNYHHIFFRRRALVSDETLAGLQNFSLRPADMSLEDLGNLAVRMSRLQLLPRAVHTRFHQEFEDPCLPQYLSDKFITVGLTYGDVVSRWAIDPRYPVSNRLVLMNEDRFRQATSRRALRSEIAFGHPQAAYRRHMVASFLLRYALEQDLSHVSAAVIREFLGTEDLVRKKMLGNFILTGALDASIAPLVELQARFQRRGLVLPDRPGVRATVRKIINKDRLPALFPALTDRLLAAA